MTRRPAWLRRLLFIPPIAVGIAVLALQLSDRTPPPQSEPTEVARPVRVIEAVAGRFVPRALGYGYAEPGTVWEAVAEVGGRVVYRHPDLERGRLLEAGTVILRIEPADYLLAVARGEADIQSVEARLGELEVREANTVASLEIERRSLVLAQEDLDRKRQLRANGNISQTSVDQAETALLVQRQRAQELENQLSLLPAERAVLEASLAQQMAMLADARLDLDRTEIRLPIDARIAEIAVESAQFVTVGQRLAVADGIDVAEVTAQVAIDRLMPLIRSELDLTTLTATELSTLPESLGLEARVRLSAGDLEATWVGRFDRISDTIDPQTRTIGIIVAVDQPYRQAIPGQRPPLAKNMYVEVELRGPPRDGEFVVPRVAVHDGPDGRIVVYVADADDRLEFRPVRLGPAQSDFVVVDAGLAAGDRVVVTDLIPAIAGMLLAPTPDAALGERLLAEAAGDVAVR